MPAIHTLPSGKALQDMSDDEFFIFSEMELFVKRGGKRMLASAACVGTIPFSRNELYGMHRLDCLCYHVYRKFPIQNKRVVREVTQIPDDILGKPPTEVYQMLVRALK